MTPKKFFSSKILLIGLIIILIILLPNFYKRLQEKKMLTNQIENINQKVKSIETENEKIEKELEALGGGEGADKILRRLYVLKKEGEEAIVMPEDLLVLPEKEKSDSGFWQKMINWFK